MGGSHYSEMEIAAIVTYELAVQTGFDIDVARRDFAGAFFTDDYLGAYRAANQHLADCPQCTYAKEDYVREHGDEMRSHFEEGIARREIGKKILEGGSIEDLL